MEEAGQDVNDADNPYGNTALYIASFEEHPGTVLFLLRAGANVRQVRTTERETQAHSAWNDYNCLHNFLHLDMYCSALIDQKKIATTKNNRLKYDTFSLVPYLTLFRLTVKKDKYLNRFLRFVDRYLVLEAGADVDLLTKNGKTAAQLAREFGHGPMARFLEGWTRGRAAPSSSSSLGRGRSGRR